MREKEFLKTKLKTLCAILILFTMLYSSVGNLVTVLIRSSKLNEISLGNAGPAQEADFYSGSLTDSWGFSAKNEEFDPDSLNLTPDKIIAEAATNLGSPYVFGNKGYWDAWDVRWPAGKGSSASTNESDIWKRTGDINISKAKGLDCSGLAYKTFRRLGVQLTNFCDGRGFQFVSGYRRIGPIPLNTDSWVNASLDSNGVISVKPYHVTWANGENIAQITPYVVSKVWIKATDNEDKYKGYRDTVESYEKFISDYNVAPGSIVITINPNKFKGVKGAQHHAWIYIGNFEGKDEVVKYFKDLGITVSDSNIKYEQEGGNAWSIESAGGAGVRITNVDPGGAQTFENGKEGKRGNGYIAFTLINDKEGSYNMNIVKKSIDDKGNPSDNTTALSGAEYAISLNNGEAKNVTTNGKTFVQNVEITEENVGEKDVYTITETKAPTGYNISENLKDIKIEVSKKSEGSTYVIDNVKVGEQTINKNESKDIEVNGVTLGITVSADATEFTVTVYNDQDNYYNLKIFKQSEEDSDWSIPNSIEGAEFSVKQFVKENDTYTLNDEVTVKSEDSNLAFVKFDKKDNKYNVYSDEGDWKGILLGNETTKDDFYRFVITETKSPDENNYNLPDWIAEGKSLVIDVTPEIKDGKYKIKNIDIYVAKVDDKANLTDQTEIKKDAEEGYATSEQESETTYKDLYVQFGNHLDINIGFKDPLIEGSYNLEFAKVERDDKPIYNSTNYVSGAQYEVIRALDIDENLAHYIDFINLPDAPVEDDDITVTTKNQLSDLFENIEVNSIDRCDAYLIKEIDNADNYNIDRNYYKLIVLKKEAKDENGKKSLAIDKVELYKMDPTYADRNWEQITDTENSTDATVKLEGNKISFIASNTRKRYDLALTKSIVYSSNEIVEKYDLNLDGFLDTSDAVLAMTIHGNGDGKEPTPFDGEEKEEDKDSKYITETDDELKEISDNIEYVKLVVARFRKFVQEYKYVSAEQIFKKWMQLDEDNDGEVSYEEGGSRLLKGIAGLGSGSDFARINGITTLELNSDNQGQKITTATYDLNKTVYGIKKSDIVTYKITVYNEGDYDSKDIQIADYIPEGMVICDAKGKKVEDGKFTCSHNGVNYEWTVSDNGRKAIYKVPEDTILKKFEDISVELDESLNSVSTYITCCIDYKSIDDKGTKEFDDIKISEYVENKKIFYNVAEIIDSTAIDDDKKEVYACKDDPTRGTTNTEEAQQNEDESGYEKIHDRDSEEDTISTDTSKTDTQDIIDTYAKKFEDIFKNTSTFKCIKSKYEYQDDDDFERVAIIEEAQLDLSLRKSITRVGSDENSLEPVKYGNDNSKDRLPIINEHSVEACTNAGTGEYYHTKDAVNIKKGDYIEYTIRVYNEGYSVRQGDSAGYAGEITDYLPEELEFVGIVDEDGTTIKKESDGFTTTSNALGSWKAEYKEDGNKVVITAQDAKAIEPKANLNRLVMTNPDEFITYYNIGEKEFNSFLYEYQEVRIICKVKDEAPTNTPFTNVAEITQYKKVNGEEESITPTDRDSSSNSIKNADNENPSINLDTYYKERVIDGTPRAKEDAGPYYDGNEDDDDFETVIIKSGKYSLKIKKENDKGEALLTPQTGFTLGAKEDEKLTSETDGTVLLIEDKSIDATKAEEGKSDDYTISESTTPEGYNGLLKPIKVSVYSQVEETALNVKNIVVYVNEGESVTVEKGKTAELKGVELTDGTTTTLKIELATDNMITITVPNSPEKLFDLSLRKFISEVRDGENVTKYDREPTVDLSSLTDDDDSTTTAIYNHSKQPVKAVRGNTVVYTLRVFNEGQRDGYATEITDYLPASLEFVTDSEINKKYGWEVISDDGRQVKTSYLKDKLIEKFNGESLDYEDIQIECRISRSAQSKVYLTNIAEITDDADENGDDVEDIDSTPDNRDIPSDEDLPGHRNEDLDDPYVPGIEDDDDFEKVYIELKGEYNFTVTKKDAETNEVIEDEKTTFDIDVYSKLTETTDEKGTKVTLEDSNKVALKDSEEKTLNTKEITASTNGIASINGITISEADKVLSPYYFIIEEVQAPDRYTGIDYRVVVPVVFEETDTEYVAKHDITQAFALVKDENGNEYKKALQDMATSENDCVSTEQTDVAINVNVPNKRKDFDLSLRKFITKVNDKEPEISREPQVDASKLASGESTTAVYEHTKEPLLVSPQDIVEYTLRIYNEGELAGYASLIMDDIPDGVVMLEPGNGENNTSKLNAEYRWKMYKLVADGEEVDTSATIEYDGKTYVETLNPNEAVIIVTDYLSKENGETMMSEEDSENPNLLQPFNPEVGEFTEENYRDIKVQFKVKPANEEGKIITNYAQVTDDSDDKGNPVPDRDSTTNEWIDGDDDQDIERIKVRYFDLALYKWVTQAIVTEDGKTTEYDSKHTAMNKANIVDVVIPKNKLDKVTVKFKYQIRVENQSQLEGYAKEVKDHIPAGLKFVADDNKEFRWVEQADGTITTDYLKDTLLQPGEIAEVTVVLTWVNGADNLGQKVNYAEISEDYNDYGAPDIDSTPDNFENVPHEDDEDGDVVMLQIRTGLSMYLRYMLIIAVAMIIVAGGSLGVKKFVLNKR